MQMISYQYDGTWEGLLTVIFEGFDRKENPCKIFSKSEQAVGLFEECRVIRTDSKRAERVAKGIIQKSRRIYNKMYRVYLSEKKEREILCFQLSRLLFNNLEQAESDYRNECVLRVKQINKEVGREVHRMHAFVRFQKAKDDTWFAFIRPDFDVLTLIASHFKKRYADQVWMIYDLKRKYGMHYNLDTVEIVEIDFEDKVKEGKLPITSMHHSEAAYQGLWRDYFEHVNIKERKNTRLHIQHVPKRYWNLMTEKN